MVRVDKIDFNKFQTGNYTERELKYIDKIKSLRKIRERKK